jgi:large subunit ribosomal protein L29
MKPAVIRSMETADLQVRVDNLRRELFELKTKAANEAIENPARIGQIRRDIARLLTERRRRLMEKGS